MTFYLILNILTFVWLSIANLWTRDIIKDTTEKTSYFASRFINQLFELELTTIANTLQTSKITSIWKSWINEMLKFYRNLKWMQLYTIFTLIMFGTFHTNIFLLSISLVVITISSVISLILIKYQRNIVHNTGKIINTVISNSYMLKKDQDTMTDSQKSDLQLTIDTVTEYLDLLLINQTKPFIK